MSEILRQGPVIPVVRIEAVEQALPMARALVAGGLPSIEVTLRTDVAIPAIEAIARDVPEVMVGAGTITNASQFDRAYNAGARFAVSPGATPALFNASQRTGLPFLPGVVSPSEILLAMETGWQYLKFFPAQAYGGINTLKALHGPFPEVRFCPTGGVRPDNYLDYLALENVMCVGGTWLTPDALVRAGDWSRITELASQVSGNRPLEGDAGAGDGPDSRSSVGEEDPGAAAEELRR